MHYQFNYILNYERNSFMLCFGGIINKMPLVKMLYLNFLSVKNVSLISATVLARFEYYY